MSVPKTDPIARQIATLRGRGFTVALTEDGQLSVEPSERITAATDQWLSRNGRSIADWLLVESGARPPSTLPLLSIVPPAAPLVSSSHTTRLPDVILDWVIPVISGAEVRVLLYIARRTYGFGKEHDDISISQFRSGLGGGRLDRGTGLHHKSIIRAVSELEARGLIAVSRPTLGDSAHGVSRYRITISDAWRPDPGVGSRE